MTAAFSHFDEQGSARMVDIGEKVESQRAASAEGWITMSASVIDALTSLPKGNAYEVARLAGIMAAKKTAELIPLCHGIVIDSVQVTFEALADRVIVRAESRCHGRTGVEMEALTAVSVALLTLYDMTKSQSKDMQIEGIKLLTKSGGRSGDWQRSDP